MIKITKYSRGKHPNSHTKIGKRGQGLPKGHKLSDETKKKIGNANSKSLKGRLPKSAFKKGMTPWNKNKHTGYITHTKENIKKMLKRREKSSLEQKFEDICNEFNLPYKFVGNGEVIIERKNPDFINTNGVKIAVEVYYKKHKENFRNLNINEWKKNRTDIFKKYDWKLLFFDETQVNYKEMINKLGE